MTKNLISENQEIPQFYQKKSQSFFDRIWGYLVLILLVLNFFYFFCYKSGSPYALPYSLWYADFRYWSDWISGCCRLVLLWAVVSTLLALVVPKNKERIFLLRRSFFQKIIGLLFLFLLWKIWYQFATLPLATIFALANSCDIATSETITIMRRKTNPST